MQAVSRPIPRIAVDSTDQGCHHRAALPLKAGRSSSQDQLDFQRSRGREPFG
jgi:hypothetical protein